MASFAFGRVTSAISARSRPVAKREFSALLSLTDEFVGIPTLTPIPGKASESSITKLASGLTIVTEDASSTTTVTLTFPKAGSSNETLSEGGASLANKMLSFKGGSGLSSALIVRNLEDDGAVPFTYAGRKSASLGFTCAPEKAERLLPLLATSCSFEKWDVKDAKKVAGVIAEEAMSSAELVLTEQLYSAAYGGQTALGKSFYATGPSNGAVRSFRERNYVMNGAVIAATGVSDHDAFVTAVRGGFSEAAAGSSEESTDASPAYMGGEARVHSPSSGFTHVAIGFKGPPNLALINVMKKTLLLSGASAFAASGLVGVYGTSAEELCAALTTTPSVDIVAKALMLAKAEAVFALDSDSKSLAEAMTESILESGSFNSDDIIASYDAITAEHVVTAFSTMLKSNPSVASIGDVSAVPYHATIAAKFT